MSAIVAVAVRSESRSERIRVTCEFRSPVTVATSADWPRVRARPSRRSSCPAAVAARSSKRRSASSRRAVPPLTASARARFIDVSVCAVSVATTAPVRARSAS